MDTGATDGEAGTPQVTDGSSLLSDAEADAVSAPLPCEQVRVNTDGRVVNIRSAANLNDNVIGGLAYGKEVEMLAVTRGESIDGDDTWYRVRSDNLVGYVFSRNFECLLPGAIHKGFYLPFECGTSSFIAQGNFGTYSHTGIHEYAYDIRLEVGSPLYAMAPGVVSAVYNLTQPGHPCYEGGAYEECFNAANYVIVDHPDGSQSFLAHLSNVTASKGQVVAQGDLLGYSGMTGFARNPHVHLERYPGECCQSIPLTFLDTEDGRPEALETVTSQNCKN